jgi:hypothetical protein
VRWHTGDPDTDPWEWRLRVLAERSDVAYAKVFFGKNGFITREWYPYFLSARRRGKTLAESYNDGLVTREARRVFDVLSDGGAMPAREIKRLGNFKREDKYKFERAMRELQNMLFITACGFGRKVSDSGEEYGWDELIYCASESFWNADVFDEAVSLNRGDAVKKIRERVRALNPYAIESKVKRFIEG